MKIFSTSELFSKSNEEYYKEWKDLVNMTKSELQKYYDSDLGKDSGLSSSEAASAGIHSGRESARWILKMKDKNWKEWGDNEWEWCKRQIRFINRMRGVWDRLSADKKTNPEQRSLMALKIWGHDPNK